MITVQDILTELGNSAWSGFNKDDMAFEEDNSMQAQTELNRALRYLLSLSDFPFKKSEKNIMAIKNVESYSMVNGQITKVYNTDTLEELNYIGDNSTYDKSEKGKPSAYWIDYTNPTMKIRLYPIPDDKYNFACVYNQYLPVKTQSGELQSKFINADDYLNMPENLEYLFMDCLVLRTMQTNNKDNQDENYQPIISEFQETWNNFVRLAKPVNYPVRVVF